MLDQTLSGVCGLLSAKPVLVLGQPIQGLKPVSLNQLTPKLLMFSLFAYAIELSFMCSTQAESST